MFVEQTALEDREMSTSEAKSRFVFKNNKCNVFHQGKDWQVSSSPTKDQSSSAMTQTHSVSNIHRTLES